MINSYCTRTRSSIQYSSPAYLTLCFVFLQTFWSVIFFHACDAKKYYLIAVVLLSHLLTSGVVNILLYLIANILYEVKAHC